MFWLREKSMLILLGFLISSLFGLQNTFTHEEGAPFSGAIVEPLKVHHAHIEDEQRINFSYINGFLKNEDKRDAFMNSLELAVDWTGDFYLGSEIFIPFSNTGYDKDNYNIGDVEIWPIKYSFINEPDTIFTGVLSFKLPTGSKPEGLGEGHTEIGCLLLLDQAYKNWYLGVNTEITTNMYDETETEFEFGTVISYSLIHETKGRIASSKPNQLFIPALSLEVISKSILRGESKGKNLILLLPAFHFWKPKSGWQTRFGIELPISTYKENDFVILFQIGNHLDWR